MRSRRSSFFVQLGLASILSSSALACGSSAGPEAQAVVQSALPRDVSPSVAPADAATLATDNAKFAMSLFHQSAGNDGDNLFFSPYSISTALAMTYAGAKGDTATQMAQALNFELAPDKLHPAFDALDLALQSRSNNTTVKVGVASSLWGLSSFHYVQNAIDTLGVDYGAGVEIVDFLHQPEPSRLAINSWVSDKTNAKIQDLLPQGSIDSDTRFVIVNAIYFKADWQSKFDPSATSNQSFAKLDGSLSTVSMMNQTSEFPYASGSNWQAIEMPYDGNKVVMDVILPASGQLPAIEAGLDANFLSTVSSSLSTTNVNLSLPKFTIEGATISLKTSLVALGMVDAFDISSADFTGLVPASEGPIFISDVLHKAYVAVDEGGTEAAAATAVVGETGAVGPAPATAMNVNRPFFTVIRDVPTDAILFMGRVSAPQSP